jgi:hypothetical protein
MNTEQRTTHNNYSPTLSFNLGAKYRWVVNATPRPLYSRERPRTHCIRGWVGPRVGLCECENLAPTGIQSPDRPARSKSQGLSYLGPRTMIRWDQNKKHIIEQSARIFQQAKRGRSYRDRRQPCHRPCTLRTSVRRGDSPTPIATGACFFTVYSGHRMIC